MEKNEISANSQTVLLNIQSLELAESLLGFGTAGLRHLDDVKAYGFAEGTALTARDGVTHLHVAEARREMHRHVLVSFLETFVFLDELHVITSYNYSTVHFHFTNSASQDTTTDSNVTRERTFLINIGAKDSFLRGLVAKTDRFEIASMLLAQKLLLLKSSFNLRSM